MALRIWLLGRFEVALQEEGAVLPASAWPSDKVRRLLKVLAYRQGRVSQPDELADLIWPDLPPESALNNVRVSVSRLRRVLEPDRRHPHFRHVLSREGGYLLPADGAWVDAHEFEGLCRRAQQAWQSQRLEEARSLWEPAVELYRGPFLPEELYEPWSVAPRERLRMLYEEALAGLAEVYELTRREAQALRLLEELLESDPLNEEASRRLMLLYRQVGNRAAALTAYRRLESELEAELGAQPVPQLQELYQALLSGDEVPTTPPPPAPDIPFVGRREEWSRLSQSWTGAEKRLLLLAGEPGIGKSRLMEEFARWATGRGAQTLWLRAVAGEELLTFRPFLRLFADRLTPDHLRALGDHAAVLRLYLPELVAPDPEVRRYQPLHGAAEETRQLQAMGAALQRVMAALGRGRSLLLFDDLQWADEASLLLLAGLVREAGQRLRLLASYRPEEGQHLLARVRALVREGLAEELSLPPLSAGETADLVRELLPGRDRLADRLHRETGGNPLFLVETVRALRDVGDESDLPPSRTVRDVILERMQRLPGQARELVEAASVVGRPFRLRTLAAMAGQEASRVAQALADPLQRRILVSPEPGWYEFSHSQVEVTVAGSLSPSQLAYWHGQVAQALGSERSPGWEALAARHNLKAGRRELAARQALAAAERSVAQHAFREALGHHRLGRQAADDSLPVELRFELVAGEQRCLHMLGLREEEEAVLEELDRVAQESGDPELQADASYRLLQYHIDTGQNAAALALVRRRGEVMQQARSRVQPADVHQRVGFLYFRLSRFEAALAKQEKALELANRAGDRHRRAYILNSLGWLLTCMGRYRDAARSLEEAIRIWGEDEYALGHATAISNLGDVHLYGGRPAEGLKLNRQALPIYQRLGYRIAEAECWADSGACLLGLDRLEEAQQALSRGLHLARELRDSYSITLALAWASLAWTREGRAAALRRALQLARECEAEGRQAKLPHAVINGLCQQALAHLGLGEPQPALRASSEAVRLLRKQVHLEGPAELVYTAHAQALEAAGREEEATEAESWAGETVRCKLENMPPDWRPGYLAFLPRLHPGLERIAKSEVLAGWRLPSRQPPHHAD